MALHIAPAACGVRASPRDMARETSVLRPVAVVADVLGASRADVSHACTQIAHSVTLWGGGWEREDKKKVG